jgi:hypothetical protein
VVIRHNDQHTDDHDHARHVPPGGDVVDLCQQADAERVDQAV